jgi:3D (Asp-Asp-Asp) domain-containing protein
MHIYSSLALIALIISGAIAPIDNGVAKADFEERILRLPSASSQISASPALRMPKLLGVFSVRTRKAWITAYSSTPDQTDDTPFITASGSRTRDGIVATNFLPFGTRVRIPGLFGNKVFVVEDRMHARKTNGMDVWMSTREEAINFGSAYADIEVLDERVALGKQSRTNAD